DTEHKAPNSSAGALDWMTQGKAIDGRFVELLGRSQAAPQTSTAIPDRNGGRPHDCHTAPRALLRGGDAAARGWRSSAERNVAHAPCPHTAARASAGLLLLRASR